MTRRFFKNSLFVAITMALVMALGCYAHTGYGMPAAKTKVAHGPGLPPDPWGPDGGTTNVAHGPGLPPDPWGPDGGTTNVAHGPGLPPDPWGPDSTGNVKGATALTA